MTIGERIALYARERGIKQTTMAEVCGITSATVSVWIKTGVESIPSGHIVPLAHLFGCAPMELLTGERYVLPDPGDETQRLIDMFESLDWEGKQVVMATAIQEKRRAEDSLARARAV